MKDQRQIITAVHQNVFRRCCRDSIPHWRPEACLEFAKNSDLRQVVADFRDRGWVDWILELGKDRLGRWQTDGLSLCTIYLGRLSTECGLVKGTRKEGFWRFAVTSVTALPEFLLQDYETT